jgi:hypothetical protein
VRTSRLRAHSCHGYLLLGLAQPPGSSGPDHPRLRHPERETITWHGTKDLSRVSIRGLLAASEHRTFLGGVPPYGYDVAHLNGQGEVYQLLRYGPDGHREIYDSSGRLVRVLLRGDAAKTGERDRAKLVLGESSRVALVRRIIRTYVEGSLGFAGIADRLNLEGVPAPRTAEWSKRHDGRWSVGTVRSLVVNPVYCGDLIWNRRASGKFHKVVRGTPVSREAHRRGRLESNPEEDWVRIEHAHEPIVDRVIFERAVAIRKERERAGLPHLGGRQKTSR